MTRYLVMILLLAGCPALLGCVNGDPSARGRERTGTEQSTAGTSEPNDADALQAAEPAQPVGRTDEAAPQPVETPEPVGVEPAEMPAEESHVGRDDTPVEPNQPLEHETPDSNDPGVQRPDDAPAPAAVTVEPNEAPAEAAEQPPAAPSVNDRYTEILAAYVRADGLVDYGALRRRRLDVKAVLTQLDELDPNTYESWPQQEKLAFWINAYNLKMLDIIGRNYPIESSWWLRLTWPPSDIRHIKGIWTDYKFIVMDEEFTLAEVERRFFRKVFDDPRVYLALTYASQSSPPLSVRPYRGETLDRRLDEQIRQFLESPQGLRIDRHNKVVRLSALFKPVWRGKEFLDRYGTDKKFKDREPATRAVLSFLTNYLPREDVEFLEVENYTLEYLNFDWRLNDTDKGY